MAKKTQNSSSQNVCEKLRNAINFSPFGRFHRASSHQQSHSTPTPAIQSTNNPIKTFVSQPSPIQLIPIESAQEGKQQLQPKVDITSIMSSKKLMFLAKEKRTHDRNNGGVQGNNEVFSEYITRVRDGMRTSSDLGIERITTKEISRRDSLNDRVSNFLNFAKIKNQGTSNVGHDMHENQNDY